MDFSGFNVIKRHREVCDKCGWTRWYLVRTENAAGHTQIRYACQGCDRRASKFISIKNAQAAGFDIDDIPYHHVKRDYKKCEVCGSSGAEYHHWAPQALFGIEAWDWPTSYLCTKCHRRWHDIVTPNISKK